MSPHRPRHLNSWSPVGGPLGSIEGMALLKEVCDWESTLRVKSLAISSLFFLPQQDVCSQLPVPVAHSKEKLTFILIVGSLMPRESVWLNTPEATAIGVLSRCLMSRSMRCQGKENQSWVDSRTQIHGGSVSKLEPHCSQSLKETSSVSPPRLVPSLMTCYCITNRPWSW